MLCLFTTIDHLYPHPPIFWGGLSDGDLQELPLEVALSKLPRQIKCLKISIWNGVDFRGHIGAPFFAAMSQRASALRINFRSSPVSNIFLLGSQLSSCHHIVDLDLSIEQYLRYLWNDSYNQVNSGMFISYIR